MDATVKKLWVDALRSGKYKQTTGSLRRDDCFCAQGILCDIYAKEKNIDWVLQIGTSGRYSMNGLWDFIPNEVEDWAGLTHLTSREAKETDTIVQMNDKKSCTFEQIADYIDLHL